MSSVTVHDVLVTEVAGDDLTVDFALQALATTTVQGFIAYKTVAAQPSSSRLIPDLDDLDEIILPEKFNEVVTIQMSPVRGG